MRAARALLDIDQRELAQRSGLSLPTIQRMESSGGVVRGNVDSLMKLVDALGSDTQITLLKDGDHRLSKPHEIALIERTLSALIATCS